MIFDNSIKIIYWSILLIITSVSFIRHFRKINSNDSSRMDGFIFIVWCIIILYPLCSEIDVFGLKLKKEFEDLKYSIQNQMLTFQSVIQNQMLTFQSVIQNSQNLAQTFNIALPTTQPTTQPTTRPAMLTSQADRMVKKPNAEKLNEMEKKILATLWHYQQEYSKSDPNKKWGFVANPYSYDFPEYLQAVAALLKLGFITVIPPNYYCFLTPDGLAFMKQNTQLQTEDNLFNF